MLHAGAPDTFERGAGLVATSIGAVVCFPKPFDLDALVERIRSVV